MEVRLGNSWAHPPLQRVLWTKTGVWSPFMVHISEVILQLHPWWPNRWFKESRAHGDNNDEVSHARWSLSGLVVHVHSFRWSTSFAFLVENLWGKKTAFGEAELCLYCTSSHSDNWLLSSDGSISTDMPAKLGLKSRLDLRVFKPPAQSSRWIRSGCWEKESHLKGMCGSQMEDHNGSIPRKPWFPGNPQTRRGIVQNQGSIHDLQTWRRQK